MAAPQHPDVLGGVQADICSFWFLLSHDEPRFNSDDDGDNSEGVGSRRALDAVVVARDGEVTAPVAETGDIVLQIQVGWWRCAKGRSSEGSDRVRAPTAKPCLNEEIDMNYVQWWSERKSEHTQEHGPPRNSNPPTFIF